MEPTKPTIWTLTLIPGLEDPYGQRLMTGEDPEPLRGSVSNGLPPLAWARGEPNARLSLGILLLSEGRVVRASYDYLWWWLSTHARMAIVEGWTAGEPTPELQRQVLWDRLVNGPLPADVLALVRRAGLGIAVAIDQDGNRVPLENAT